MDKTPKLNTQENQFIEELKQIVNSARRLAESHLQIWRTALAKSLNSLPKLSWSHYERLMRVANTKARNWYMHEAEAEMWAYRTLDRNLYVATGKERRLQ